MSPSAPQVQDPLIGRVIDGRYEILQRVGEGGMGVVYRARQVSIDRIVALKMLNKEMANDPNWVQRFYNEAKACSRLQHPNTIRMFDFGQTREGKLFMTMEFLEGHSLRHAIAAGAPMAPARVLKIAIQCCASLSEAHSLKIIHRDIKPDNVFLLNLAGSPDFVKLLDFSVAKLLQEGNRMRTQAGIVFGTPQYMSPEQGRGVPLDVRSDLYSLGILTYEMLTGRVPYDDPNPMSVLQMHITENPAPLPASVPDVVQQVCMRALSKDTSQRFQSASEMMQACQQAFAQVGAQAAGMVSRPAAQVPHAPSLPNQPMSPSARTMYQPDGGAPPPQHYGGGPPSAPHYGGGPPPAQHYGGGPPPAQHYGGGPPPAQNYGGGQSGGAASAKTIMADAVDAASLVPQSSHHPAAAQKTMMADAVGGHVLPPNIPHGHMGMPPGGPGMPIGGGVPAKTMMLQDTEGIVSFTGSGGQPMANNPYSQSPAAGNGAMTIVGDEAGPSVLFWALSLATGLVVGVLAYVILLKVIN